MQRLHRHLAPVLLPALVLSSMAPAQAQSPDAFTLNAAYALQSDSNLFRLPASADLGALVGKSSASERIGIASAGLRFNKAYSLQRLEFDINLTDYHYQNFGYLGFTATNYSAAWRWSLTPTLRGNLSTERKETLNSFADYRNVSLRNTRTDSNTRFDADYDLGGSWRLLGGAALFKRTNLQPLVAEGDYRSTAADVGARYALFADSSLRYSLKGTTGSYLNRVLSPVGFYDDGFRQLDHELALHWVITGNSTADLSAVHLKRTHAHFAQRDFSGVNASAKLHWNLSGKTSLVASWVRELASYQTSSSNYSQTQRLTVGPVWQISPKAVARLRYEFARISYLGSPTTVAATQRRDTTRDTTLSLDWQPHPALTVGTSVQRAARSSNVADLDYKATLATVSLQISY